MYRDSKEQYNADRLATFSAPSPLVCLRFLTDPSFKTVGPKPILFVNEKYKTSKLNQMPTQTSCDSRYLLKILLPFNYIAKFSTIGQ